MRSAFIVFLTCALAACATPQQTASPRRQSRPLGADTETQKAAFDLIQITLICLAHNKPIHPGKIILAGVFAEPGAPVKVFDSESTPGNERGIACAAVRPSTMPKSRRSSLISFSYTSTSTSRPTQASPIRDATSPCGIQPPKYPVFDA